MIKTGLDAGYDFKSYSDWQACSSSDSDYLAILRHDVDRFPHRALAMAQGEHALGVTSTYFFRTRPCSFRPAIIREIASLNHEIGYHYEDLSSTRGNFDAAVESFGVNLQLFDGLFPVRMVAMHGSPLSPHHNLDLWEIARPEDFGVKDATISFDFSSFVYLTDTGRTFAQSGSNLRDHIPSLKHGTHSFNGTDSVKRVLAERAFGKFVVSCHPERWTNSPLGWSIQLAQDRGVNAVKRALAYLRPPKAS
jgi:hypothetical protein